MTAAATAGDIAPMTAQQASDDMPSLPTLPSGEPNIVEQGAKFAPWCIPRRASRGGGSRKGSFGKSGGGRSGRVGGRREDVGPEVGVSDEADVVKLEDRACAGEARVVRIAAERVAV